MNSFVPVDTVRTCCSIDPLRSCTKTTRTFLHALTLVAGRSSSIGVGAEVGDTGMITGVEEIGSGWHSPGYSLA